jgi:hypothetical protein
MPVYDNRNREREIDNGFVYPIFNFLVKLLYYLNVVELFKWITVQIVSMLNRNTTDQNLKKRRLRMFRNHSVDFFIILKFLYIFYVIYYHQQGFWFTLISIYLLIFNAYIYFYYHIWEEGAIKGEYFTIHRTRRRFINLIQSVLFMQLIYAYLYSIPFRSNFTFKVKTNLFIESLLYSFSHTFPYNFDLISAKTLTGHLIDLSEVILAFIFLTVVLSQSIPKVNTKP